MILSDVFRNGLRKYNKVSEIASGLVKWNAIIFLDGHKPLSY
jgi:hypothetical protein